MTALAWLIAGLAASFVIPACGHRAAMIEAPPDGIATAASDPGARGHAEQHGGSQTPASAPDTRDHTGHESHGGGGSESTCHCTGAMCCPPTLPPPTFVEMAIGFASDAAPLGRLILAVVPPRRPPIFAVPLPQPPPRLI
jgi:hypothetical protein